MLKSIAISPSCMAYLRLSVLVQVEGVLQRAARREDKTERLKREQDARDAVLSLYTTVSLITWACLARPLGPDTSWGTGIRWT